MWYRWDGVHDFCTGRAFDETDQANKGQVSETSQSQISETNNSKVNETNETAQGHE